MDALEVKSGARKLGGRDFLWPKTGEARRRRRMTEETDMGDSDLNGKER